MRKKSNMKVGPEVKEVNSFFLPHPTQNTCLGDSKNKPSTNTFQWPSTLKAGQSFEGSRLFQETYVVEH
jgi:hypothetical protein